MADLSDISWQQNDEANNSASPNGFPVGVLPTQIGGAIRAHRGASKRFWDRINSMAISTGTGAAYRIAYEVPPTALVKGEVFRWFAHVANTGPATLRINEVQTAPIVHNDDGAALIAGNIPLGSVITTVFDGTVFRAIGLDKYGPRMGAVETSVTALAASTLKTDISNIKTANKGRVTTGTVIFNYADGTYQSIEIGGPVAFDVANMPTIGGTIQINITFTGGSITMPPGVVWDLGSGEKTSTFSEVGVTWVVNRRYRVVFEGVNGVLTGLVS
ncbi:hypothetical protein U0C82_08255 [Fulvimarina sp. 2208YS6-2-32]|uniref:Uncharacterized protein n=1 Tax=Fulvimarina uroteuthidis TaxID=3098149 RepID=A0ABU5I1N8_9HYPH|nr:hypothetical protein [Fulvimarina sp. 2208YS6-2-32]MDY8109136.1 hypothetical protein [Fulvimarina sp. 2208YS6-2-32]